MSEGDFRHWGPYRKRKKRVRSAWQDLGYIVGLCNKKEQFRKTALFLSYVTNQDFAASLKNVIDV